MSKQIPLPFDTDRDPGDETSEVAPDLSVFKPFIKQIEKELDELDFPEDSKR